MKINLHEIEKNTALQIHINLHIVKTKHKNIRKHFEHKLTKRPVKLHMDDQMTSST